VTRNIVRLLVLAAVMLAGAWTSRALGAPVAVGVAAGALAGAAAVLLEFGAASLAIERLFWGATGGLAGLGAGLAVGLAAAGLVPRGAEAMTLALAALCGAYVGAATALGRLADLDGISRRLFPGAGRSGSDKVLDTSAIIDGRIADVCETGFVNGALVVPRFVLGELQRLADSPDGLRRNRGKRGFEVLQRLQRLPRVAIEIDERAVAGTEVDQQLLELARVRGARLVTTDYNLTKLAELHGVRVLNVNGLANALKPVVLPGETMTVQVLREGKEPGQGVAYLADGTMVVIEQGRRYIGQPLDVVVTSVLQTPAGRMIFSRSREDAAVAPDD
jgi:rRNA-processing protein FCF1